MARWWALSLAAFAGAVATTQHSQSPNQHNHPPQPRQPRQQQQQQQQKQQQKQQQQQQQQQQLQRQQKELPSAKARTTKPAKTQRRAAAAAATNTRAKAATTTTATAQTAATNAKAAKTEKAAEASTTTAAAAAAQQQKTKAKAAKASTHSTTAAQQQETPQRALSEDVVTSPFVKVNPRALQTTTECEENSRWTGLPWVYLTYTERVAWGELGWSETWWDLAWGGDSSGVESIAGRCFGGSFLIGESGSATCLLGELIYSYDECLTASDAYEAEYSGDLYGLGEAVNDEYGTPGCHIQDRVGFEFNEASLTGAVSGYSPICKYNSTIYGSCPSTTTTTEAPSVDGITLLEAIPEAILTCYGDLTTDQQDAVRILGYTISSWHACMPEAWEPPTCSWPSGIPTEDADCLDRLDYLLDRYDPTSNWDDLSYRTKEAMVTLGWDEDGTDWANRLTPKSYAKPFAGLTPPSTLSKTEQNAATFLMYTEDVWEGCEDDSECVTRLQRQETEMATWGLWSEMASGLQTRLKVLGWTDTLWSAGELPASASIDWDKLTQSQRVAATLLGYRKDVWENCVMSDCLTRYNYVVAKYEGLSWSDLSEAQQDAWTMLLHSEALWEEGGMLQTRAFNLRWEELTAAQQRMATFLGHTEGTWQGCNYEWTGEDSSSDNSSTGTIDDDPYRTVRVEMTIEVPYSTISGNIYGSQVATMPTSFIEMFELAIARALFCGNPDYKNYTDGAYDENGDPVCKQSEEYERQKHRVVVVTVTEGSILVNFLIVKNQSSTDTASPVLYQALATQLESRLSPIGQDVEFGKYAAYASIKEVSLSSLDTEEMAQVEAFELKRAAWSDSTACLLKVDARLGLTSCDSFACHPRHLALSAILAALIAHLWR